MAAHTGSVGGSWGSSSNAAPAPNHSMPSVTISSIPGATHGNGGTAVSDGTYEKNLVLELCPPGGMKPVPPPEKLANFARSCASLNSDLVCPVLLDCLEDGQPWIIRAKALCAMETCIANGTKLDGTNPYRDFFFACQDEIAPLVAHARPAISDPARRVLTLLGVSPGSMPHAAAAPVAAPAPAPNLLDFDNGPSEAPAPSHAPPPPQTNSPSAVAASSSMFGGMQVKNSPVPTHHQSVLPESAAPPSSVTPNLLDFDAVAPAPSLGGAPLTSAPNPVAIPATQPPVAVASSMFDQLSMNETEDKKHTVDMASVVGNGSSAFGFMNSNEPPPPPSFDPLKNNNSVLTPNSALKKTMQMSPEQMQAMAYQQMMMQQQQMQMQMAMAMQHQQMGGVAMPGGVPMYPPLGVPGGGVRPGVAAPPQFSFAPPKPAKKDDKKFDFVKDAMHTAGHKK